MSGKVPPPFADASAPSADAGAVANLLMAWIGLSMKKSRNMEGLKLLSDLGMTVPQSVTLHMCAFENDVTMTTLVERLGLSASAVSSMVQRMVELDLVTRSEDERDRRQKVVRVTETGRVFIERLLMARYEDMRASLEPISVGARAELARALARMLDEIAPGFSAAVAATEQGCSASEFMRAAGTHAKRTSTSQTTSESEKPVPENSDPENSDPEKPEKKDEP